MCKSSLRRPNRRRTRRYIERSDGRGNRIMLAFIYISPSYGYVLAIEADGESNECGACDHRAIVE